MPDKLEAVKQKAPNAMETKVQERLQQELEKLEGKHKADIANAVLKSQQDAAVRLDNIVASIKATVHGWFLDHMTYLEKNNLVNELEAEALRMRFSTRLNGLTVTKE